MWDGVNDRRLRLYAMDASGYRGLSAASGTERRLRRFERMICQPVGRDYLRAALARFAAGEVLRPLSFETLAGEPVLAFPGDHLGSERWKKLNGGERRRFAHGGRLSVVRADARARRSPD